MSRRIAREVAMKLVFSQLLGGEDTYRAVLDKSGIPEEPAQEDIDFSETVVAGIQGHIEEIDAIIENLAIGWSLDRMPRVDLCIMRVAVFEMLYLSDMPCGVSINEAVELAKVFAGERSPAYINGMLGTLARQGAPCTPQDS